MKIIHRCQRVLGVEMNMMIFMQVMFMIMITKECHITVITDGGERRNPLDGSKVGHGST